MCVCVCVCVRACVRAFFVLDFLLSCVLSVIQVGIDLVGPLPKMSRGNQYIVTLVDYFSKWPEAEALQDKTAKGVALFLYRLMCRLVCHKHT